MVGSKRRYGHEGHYHTEEDNQKFHWPKCQTTLPENYNSNLANCVSPNTTYFFPPDGRSRVEGHDETIIPFDTTMSSISLGQPKESLYLFPISESFSQPQPFPIGSESKPSQAQAGLDMSYDVHCAVPTHSEASPAAGAVSKSGGNSYDADDMSRPTIPSIHPTKLDISPSAPPITLDVSPSYQTQNARAGGEDLGPASKPSDEGSKGEVYRKKLNVEFEKLRAVLQVPDPGSDDRIPGKREILEAARLRIQGLEQECNALRTEKKNLQQQIQVLMTNPADVA